MKFLYINILNIIFFKFSLISIFVNFQKKYMIYKKYIINKYCIT
jgi:hypothetical protein